jgi:predicted solute-binding protein/REP element-mobilizing transposase RayT
VKPVRIGCVKYLNARPLIHGWGGGAIDFDHPAALCRKLHRGDLDVALVSSLEFLRRPIYRIVDGVSISSRGEVYSVIVAHGGELARVKQIELDPASETSVALLRCLLGQRGLHPRLVRNIDLESVRPAELHSAESVIVQRSAQPGTADKMSAGRTGQRLVFRPFDEQGELHRSRRNLPHWEQAGATYFVTFRLADAVPASLASEWREELQNWRRFRPEPLDDEGKKEYRRRFLKVREDWLDQGHGSCLLRQPEAAAIVAEALRHFDSRRYHLDAFVVMPNHVHVLLQPLPGQSLKQILRSWKSYSARQINKILGRTGSIWMEESFDRIVRDWNALQKYRNYIAHNPEKARLPVGEFILSLEEKLWNTDLESVHPAELHSAESVIVQRSTETGTADKMSAGRTGQRPVFRLLIGDQAIRFRQQNPGYPVLDLGEEWSRVAQLPFVFALWLIRPEVGNAEEIADALRQLRDRNLQNLDDLVSSQTRVSAEFCRKYYREHLFFDFGEREKAGLREFHRRCLLNKIDVAAKLALILV